MVEEFEVSLRPAAGCGFWCGTALAMTTQFAAVPFASSPSLWCSVLLGVLFACVVCVVVVFASTRYVRMLLLLI